MFEFLESQAMRLIEEITKTATGMDSDAEASLTQANQNEQEATQAEADATAEEGSCPHYKDVEHTETETDEDTGETHPVTVIERVADLAEDAASRARAASLRARAASLRSAAAALKALATALRAQLDAIKAQRQRFADAVAEVNKKADDTKQKLDEGTGLIVGVIRSFSVPIVSGAVNMVKNTANSILGNVGIDLSDGFDENDVYGLTGWIAQTAVDTGAFVVKTFVSTTVASTLGGGMMGTTGAFVVGKVVGPTIDEAFGEKAVDGVHTFLTSALEFFGIKAKPDEKETATAGTGEVETILAGDKANLQNITEDGKKGNNGQAELNNANGQQQNATDKANQLAILQVQLAEAQKDLERKKTTYDASITANDKAKENERIAKYQLENAKTVYDNSKSHFAEMEKDQSEKWSEYQKKLSINGKNSYPANDAEKEWRASKEAAEKYNMETVYIAKKNVDKYQENYERMESRLETDNASHDKITKQYEDAQAKLDQIQQEIDALDKK